MAKSARFYRRLTRSRSGIGTSSSLWLGPDHLLLVTSSGWSENYQRFYFRDIQCLVAADSIRSTVFNAIFGGLLLFCAIPALILVLTGNGISAWILLPVVPSSLLLGYNLYLGRSCTVSMTTGVQSIVLPPLSRFRRTRNVFAHLVPLIKAAQASLVPPPLAPQPTPPTVSPLTGRSDLSDQSSRSNQSAPAAPPDPTVAAPSAQ